MARGRKPRAARTALAIAGLAFAAASAAGACAPVPPRTAVPVAAPQTAARLPMGTWRVVGHYAVGSSGMNMEDANAWLKREARYSRTTAGFPPDTCRTPTYVSRTRTVADLALDYHVRPGDLQIPLQQVQVIDVRCAGAWSAPGSRLIVLGPNRLDTYWNGTMLELERERP